MTTDLWIAVAIFAITYAVIVMEKVHRTVAALLGGMAMVLAIRSFTQEVAFVGIDLNVILLLAGMMIIANVLSETGFFQWLAVKAVQLGKGRPIRILQILCVVVALMSALLDNVTVVVLMAPVTLIMAANLGISPLPYLIAAVLASNIGGAATLVGDPPNILIGSAAQIDYLTFLVNAAPMVAIALLIFLVMAPVLLRSYFVGVSGQHKAAAAMRTAGLITNPVLLRQTLIVLGLVMVGFLTHGALGVDTATIALAGAALLLLWTRRDPHEVLRDVEWPTIFFFIGLFVLVEGVVHVGAIDRAADWLLGVTRSSPTLTALTILWVSAVVSGVVDNIPYAAAMIPLIESLGRSGLDSWPLWWALVFGADFGGNITLVGASANVVVASFAERSGHHISFGRFLLYGAISTFVVMLVTTLYLWLRYL